MDTPPTVLLLVIQASKCNEPLTPLRGPLLLTVQWWSNLAERLSSPLCHTVGRHRCILESTHGGITNGFHWQWNDPPCRILMSHYYAGASWHGPTIFGLGFVSGTSGSVRSSPNTLEEPRRHSGFAPRLTLSSFGMF